MALGVLGYTGEEFRAMTLAEFVLAFEGYFESKGIKKPKEKFVTRNDLLELVDKYGG